MFQPFPLWKYGYKHIAIWPPPPPHSFPLLLFLAAIQHFMHVTLSLLSNLLKQATAIQETFKLQRNFTSQFILMCFWFFRIWECFHINLDPKQSLEEDIMDPQSLEMMCVHSHPAVRTIVCPKYLVYVFMYMYYQLREVQVQSMVVVVVGGSVPACGWSAGQGDTGQMKGSDVLTRPHSHFQQANKCHFSDDFNGKKKKSNGRDLF